jgi:glyoxalase family protein
MNAINGLHHLTICSAGAQDDVDFFHHLLGQSLVKKTILMNGTEPIYHLYYGNRAGDPGTLVTSFPFRQRGIKARRGSGQIKSIGYSIPSKAIDFWMKRFSEKSMSARKYERFGETRIQFEHPCGVLFELIGNDADTREPCTTTDIAAEFAIRGVHGITVSLRDVVDSIDFMQQALGFKYTGHEGASHRFETQAGGPGKTVEFLHEPDVPQGSAIYGEGIIHHVAFDIGSVEKQADLRETLFAMGYIDTSDAVDRNYFKSVYFRLPGGAIFEASVSHPLSFTKDEPADSIGQEFQLPPWLAGREAEMLAKLEPISLAR